MKIYRNMELEEQIYQAARKAIDKDSKNRTDGMHFSDLITPRKAFFKIKDPKPLTKAEIGYFVAGLAHHDVILSIMNRRGITSGETDEGSSEWNGIWYSPDYNLGFLAEIKTNRRMYAPADTDLALKKEYKHYLKQLTQYMAAEDKEVSALIVFYINLKEGGKGNKQTVPQFRAYEVTLTKRERKQIRKDMLQIRDLFNQAVEENDHTILPLCPAWMCARGGYKGPAIPACPWYDVCRPDGRYPLEQFEKARRRGDFDDD